MKASKFILLSLVSAALCACGNPNDGVVVDTTSETVTVIYYGSAYNNLSSDITGNIEILAGNTVPLKGAKKKLLAFTHAARTDNDFSTPTRGYLIQLSLNYDSTVLRDTLKTYPADILSTDPSVMSTVLKDAASFAPSDHYGLILSSHGTGWLPEGYYNHGEKVFRSGAKTAAHGSASVKEGFPARIQDDGLPKTRSFAAEFYRNGSGTVYSHEMELPDLAAGLPFKFDFIIFDACFMGGIETAWELRDKAGRICFSQAEVLAEGFDYSALAPALLKDSSSPEEFAKAFFKHYDSMKGAYRTATVSVVDCSRLQPLANVCRDLFAKYRDALGAIDPDTVQPYFRDNKHWFYDLEDILLKAGIDSGEKAALEAALDGCITYNAATPSVLNMFDINIFSGFSMYLPCSGSLNLDNFYKTLAWNMETGLVE